MKKKVRTIILIVWTLAGVGLIAAIAFTDGFDLTKPLIKNIGLIYAIASCVLSGAVYHLSHK